jgi:acetyltransferase
MAKCGLREGPPCGAFSSVSVATLDTLFRPRSIALIGADNTPRSVGGVLARNLLAGSFDGPVMPVHPRDAAVHGVLAYRSVADLPVIPDLAVIASPPEDVPGLIADLGARGTRAVVVVSAGFDRAGPAAGAALRQGMLDAAKPHRLRIMGPACLGMMVPALGVDATYAHARAKPGDLAFVSQSGSLMTLMLDWAAARGAGFSLLASLGDMADVDFGDLLDHLALDPLTRAVLLCVDHVAHPRKFLSAARAAARLKPVIVFSAGRSDRIGGAASASPRQPRRADVYDAAFRRAGMLPVPSLADLVAAAGTLGTGIRVNGDRIAILSNGRGIGEVAGDLVLREGGKLAQLADATLAALDAVLPATWGRRNPVNLFADATAARYRDALGPLLADPGIDAIVAINTPTAVGDTLEAARATADRLAHERKPVAAVWLEQSTLEETRRLFAEGRIPLHDGPAPAIEALMQLVRYRRNQDMLMETPASVPELFERDAEQAREITRRALADGRNRLSEAEALQVVAAYGIPVAASHPAASAEEAAAVAEQIGFPVALQALGSELPAGDATWVAPDLLNVTALLAAARRLGRRWQTRGYTTPLASFAVRPWIDRNDASAVRLGIALDETFGPVIVVGRGGLIGQLLPDQAVALPPLNLNLARQVTAETDVSRLLQGACGDAPEVLDEIALALVKLSQMAADIAEIDALEIDPLLANIHGIVALTADIRLAPAPAQPAEARLAIRPYPSEFEKTVHAPDGRALTLRPIRPEDEPALQAFVLRQSPEDRRLRFFLQVKELNHQIAARLTQIDYDREMAFVLIDPHAGPAILGIMSIFADPEGARAEYAGAVRSDLKGQGLGRLLLEEIVECCQRRGIREIWGEVLRENAPMLGLARKLGFLIKMDRDDPSVMIVTRPLQ